MKPPKTITKFCADCGASQNLERVGNVHKFLLCKDCISKQYKRLKEEVVDRPKHVSKKSKENL